MIHGVDVSSHQPRAFDTDGLDFAIIKATEGTTYVNEDMAAQAEHARKAGLVVGFYHFVRPGSMNDQARYFVEQCASDLGDLLVLDWEDRGVSCAQKDAFLKAVKALRPNRHRVLLYCNRDFWLHRDNDSYCADGLWIADPDHLAGHPAITHDWVIHQYGISGGMDRNVAAFTTRSEMFRWADPKGHTAPVPSAPKPARAPAPAPKPAPTLEQRVAALERRVSQLEARHP